jgi:NAD(P)-dependent dehydrogenase (short-subunit alcohol dehydrogenase family)/acyl carrier protein
MLDLDLDLEADLGIDTVKQAELFAAARSYYGIPRREDLILADYNTLRRVVGFMQENINQAAPVKSAEVSANVEPNVVVDSDVIEPVPQVVPQSVDSEKIKAHVLSVVSEKTGYPVEMLDLELDLEADLGIDTVKQAELFAAVRTYYGIPRREDLVLADYNTLAKVIGFIESSLANIEESKENSETIGTDTRIEKTTATPAENTGPEVKRRVPVPALFPRLDLCLPTGISLEGSRVVVVKDGGKVATSLVRELGLLKAQVLETSLADARTKLVEWVKDGEVNGVYFLPGLDTNPDWEKGTPADWTSFLDQRLEALYHIARSLPEKAFFIGATRMGGLQGIFHTINPLGGGTSGFLKALRRERPESLIKTLDFTAKATSANIASSLVAETISDPDTGEIGYQGDLRFGTILQPCQKLEATPGGSFEGSVFVVSGGAGGITAAVVRDLAKNTHGRFYLLGRTRLISRDDPDLTRMGLEPNLFKQELQVRMAQEGAKVTPVQVEKKLAELERVQAVYDLIDAVTKAGAKAEYIQCDVTDPEAVTAAVQEISAANERVDVFIHAAGIEKSRKIDTKSIEEFKQTVSIKADGFSNVFRALEAAKKLPKTVVFFSSVAGRFGNAGQTDYSAGNDLLSKYAAWLPAKYPNMQAVSIDWGAWAEIGMASRGSIPRLMEHFGIEMIHPNQAAPMVLQELASGRNGEVVIAGSLGQMESSEVEKCGFDFPKADEALRKAGSMHKMFSHLVGCNKVNGIRLEATLNPDDLPYLRDHAINGVPVLPGVIGIQGFSTAAKHVASVLASGKKGFEVGRLEDIQFLAPFKFYDNKPRTIIWTALPLLEGEDLVVKVTLESDIRRVDGRIDHTLHFSGLVYLAENQPVEKTDANPPTWGKKKAVSAEDIYRLYFHGPSFQVLDAAQSYRSNILGRLKKDLLIDASGKLGPLSTPLLIELCFQTAGLWEAGATGTLALPASVGKLTVYPRPMNGVPIYAEVKPRECGGKLAFDARVLDSKGNVFVEVEDYRTSPLPFPAEESQVEPMKVLVTNRDQNCG